MTRKTVSALCLLLLAGCAVSGPPPSPPPRLVWPPSPQPARIEYVGSISTPEDLTGRKSWLRKLWEAVVGRTEVQILRPYGLWVDREARLYVADPAARVVHVFDRKARKYRALTKIGARRFEMPIGVVGGSDGTLYVTDSGLATVAALGKKGKLLREFGRDLQRPTGVALSPAGDRLYVVDTLGHEVAVFDPGGRRIGTIGRRGTGDGEFNFPTNIAVDRAGFLYVTDTMNFQVKIFAPDGTPTGNFGRLGDGTGDLSQPKGIGLDSDGHVYVIEGLHDVFQVFDRQGRFLLGVGGTGTRPGSFWLPTGLYIDHEDRIYVADSYNNRVQIFQYLRANRP